jgi:hypothetical protein
MLPAVDGHLLTVGDFRRAHEVANRPLVIRGAVRRWPAVGKWTPSWLLERFGERRLPHADGAPGGDLRFGDVLKAIVTGWSELKPQLQYAVRNIWLREHLPELCADVWVLDYFADSWFGATPLRQISPRMYHPWLELFVSSDGARFPFIHVDRFGTHAWIAQVHGRKRAFLWPPGTEFRTRQVDRGTDLAANASAPAWSGTLEAGDVLFVPSGWPHTTETPRLSISVSGNYFNASNWTNVRRGVRADAGDRPGDRLRAAVALAAGHAVALRRRLGR